jgi:hypothetical protein
VHQIRGFAARYQVQTVAIAAAEQHVCLFAVLQNWVRHGRTDIFDIVAFSRGGLRQGGTRGYNCSGKQKKLYAV